MSGVYRSVISHGLLMMVHVLYAFLYFSTG